MTIELCNKVDFKKLNNFMKTFVGKKNTFLSQLRPEQLADLNGPLHPQLPHKTKVQDAVLSSPNVITWPVPSRTIHAIDLRDLRTRFFTRGHLAIKSAATCLRNSLPTAENSIPSGGDQLSLLFPLSSSFPHFSKIKGFLEEGKSLVTTGQARNKTLVFVPESSYLQTLWSVGEGWNSDSLLSPC